ncbi:MAG: acyl-CoA esterase [Methanoregulaceae archaeon PtaU1.Bin059]|nr:MAG: acyl-CoA esterase [Methanoregulaceae archaeon PtaU1.Bin059]
MKVYLHTEAREISPTARSSFVDGEGCFSFRTLILPKKAVVTFTFRTAQFICEGTDSSRKRSEAMVYMMTRKYFDAGGIRLSYLDNEQRGCPVLLCLHGLFGNARAYCSLADALQNDWHVYSLDQRGHGWSDHAAPGHYQREDYLCDIIAFIESIIRESPVVILGHSLGGINAYQVAARRKDLVRALIIEDAGAVEQDDASFARDIVDCTPTLQELGKSLEEFGITDPAYFLESAVERDEGWAFRFDKDSIPESQQNLNDDWWEDFLGSSCPALLLHGGKSWVVTAEHIREMAEKRPNTTFRIFPDAGHTVQLDEPSGYTSAVIEFLNRIS